ncbi:MAG TPA: carboxypeptidase-like regulatory domain-containing protein [Kofleriaceae bacterium]|nr:carboxypeptidase-like regulatory domain-containing protein [Kofleriaceae bacterium]
MSARTVLFVFVGAVIAVVAWFAWPRGHEANAPADAATAPRVTAPIVRGSDNAAGGSLPVRFALRDRRGGALADTELSVIPTPPRVTDPDGAAAPAAPNAAPITATSGADGIATMTLAPGLYTLAIANRALAVDHLELDGAPDREIEIASDEGEPPPPPEPLDTEDRSGGVVGTVLGGGAHLPDFTVALVYDGAIGPGKPVVHAGAPHPIELAPRRFVGGGGAFRWPELPAGGYDVWIWAPGWGAAHTHTNVEANAWGDASITLSPAASVSGPVQDGRGVAVAKVIVTAELDGRVLDQGISDADGIYLLDDLPGGTITLRARIVHDACEPKTEIVSAAAGKRTTHTIEMTCAWQGQRP